MKSDKRIEGKVIQKKNRKRVQNHTFEKNPKKTRTDNEPQKISISDAVVLAALTVFAYIFHYFFEYGYLSYFDIPTAFISFNLTEMIPAIFFLVVTYFIFVFVLGPTINYLLRILPGFIKMVITLTPLFMLIFLGFSLEIILLLLFSILLIYAIDKLRKYRTRKITGEVIDQDTNTYKPIREKIVNVETKTSFDPLINRILPSGSLFLLFYFLFFALVGSMVLGRLVAMTRTSFPVNDTASPRCAVIYITTDRYICKPIDNNNRFENSFSILYYQGNQNVEFRNESIGPLRPIE